MSSDFLKPRQFAYKYPTDFLLGELLVKSGIIAQKQLDAAVKEAGGKALNVGQMLIVARYMTARDLQVAVDAQSALRDRVVDMATAIGALKHACRAGIPFADAVRAQDPSATRNIPTNKLGEILLEAGIIDGDQFGKALQRSLATGLPLGRILVLNGAVSDALLTTALEIQVRVRDEMLTREEAIDYLRSVSCQDISDNISSEKIAKIQSLLKAPRKTGIRLGELLVLAGLMAETDVMNALELGLVNDQPIGQILVLQGFLSEELLESALKLQELADSGGIDGAQAADRLRKIHTEGVTFEEAVADVVASYGSPGEIDFHSMLTVARVLTLDDIQAAFETAFASPQFVANVLMMTGYLDEATADASLRCHSAIVGGYLNQQDALVVLDYCLQKLKERPITYEQALEELGWNLSLDGSDFEDNAADFSPDLQPMDDASLSFGVEELRQENDEQVVGTSGEWTEVVTQAARVDDGYGSHQSDSTTEEIQEGASDVPVGDWSLPAATVSIGQDEVSVSDNQIVEVSEQELSVTADDIEPIGKEAPVVPPASKRGISLAKMKESARELNKNRANVASGAGKASGKTESTTQADKSVGAARQQIAPGEANRTAAIVSPFENSPKRVSLKNLLTPKNSGNTQQSHDSKAADLPAPIQASTRRPPTGAAEQTIEIDPKADALANEKVTEAKPGVLQLTEEEKNIIARASSLSAKPEDLQAAALILGRKEKSLKGVGAGHSRTKENSAEGVAADAKKKITEPAGEGPFVIDQAFLRLADSYYEEGKYSEAENLYNRIVIWKERKLGEDHPDLIKDLNNLAGVLCIQAKFKEAEPYVKRCVRLLENSKPEDKLQLAESLNTLAGIYFQQDKIDLCEPLLAKSLKLKEEELGTEHPGIADNLRDYAKFLKKAGRLQEAERLYSRAKTILAIVHQEKTTLVNGDRVEPTSSSP